MFHDVSSGANFELLLSWALQLAHLAQKKNPGFEFAEFRWSKKIGPSLDHLSAKFQWIFTMPIAAVLKSSHPVLRGSQPPAGCTIFADQQGQWDTGRSQRFRDGELRGHPQTAPSGAIEAPAMVWRSREGRPFEAGTLSRWQPRKQYVFYRV